ncbi:MAG: nicotinate (nicotinamide) nucleotide adenylyltransferase [Bacilli bacterium]|jgi:nicotinate-nucleotide adenylyltransferase|nr:nicotinate (nicotinamide) nucleotide adenylyltransferase [Bacilli bacterium]
MRIGVFGGSFNPPHKMHEDIAHSLKKSDLLDKIIFVPTGSEYKYKNNLLPDQNRYDMVKLITDAYDYLDVSDYELKSEVVYTCETLAYFKDKYPKDEIYFICGLDNLSYIDSWKNAEYILNNFKILVIKRDTDDLEKVMKRLDAYKSNILVVDMKENPISSTAIRKDITDSNNSVYLNENVLKYIKDNDLYR